MVVKRDGVGSPDFSRHWSPNPRHLGCLKTEDGNSADSVVLSLRSKEVNEIMHEEGMS